MLGIMCAVVWSAAEDVPWTWTPEVTFENTTSYPIKCTEALKKSSSRLTFTAFPRGLPPKNGWPLMMMFMVSNFPSQANPPHPLPPRPGHEGWLPHDKPYGVWEPPLSAMSTCWGNGSFTMDGCSFDQLGGAMWEQRYKQMLLAHGVAIMVINRGHTSWAQTRREWEDPRSEDPKFFDVLLPQIRAGRFGPLDPSKVIVNGWSTGGHFSSWLIELWASKNLVMEGVTIVAGVFLSSGSFRCFGGTHTIGGHAPPLTDCASCNSSSACFSQMPPRRGMGCSSSLLVNGTAPCCEMCCPANVTEDYYLAHPDEYHTHPPCFLAQLSTYDVNSDLCAARKYHDTLRLHGVHSELQLALPSDEHCFCVGTPGEPAANGSNYSRFCPQIGGDVFPDYGPMGLNCMGHSLGFATMVGPLVKFVLNATGLL